MDDLMRRKEWKSIRMDLCTLVDGFEAIGIKLKEMRHGPTTGWDSVHRHLHERCQARPRQVYVPRRRYLCWRICSGWTIRFYNFILSLMRIRVWAWPGSSCLRRWQSVWRTISVWEARWPRDDVLHDGDGGEGHLQGHRELPRGSHPEDRGRRFQWDSHHGHLRAWIVTDLSDQSSGEDYEVQSISPAQFSRSSAIAAIFQADRCSRISLEIKSCRIEIIFRRSPKNCFPRTSNNLVELCEVLVLWHGILSLLHDDEFEDCSFGIE